jgi:SAM-dependent methyltransferase
VQGYRPTTYGDRIADIYDAWVATIRDPAETERAVAFLAELAAGGPALELGIGTGRVALPLAERGVAVSGIDASDRMVEQLRRRPGGDAIPVSLGDFADVDVDGRFALIYVVFNTFFALLSQDAQLGCFQRVAEHLSDEGTFLIEAFVPDLTRYHRNQRVATMRADPDQVVLDVARVDPAAQRISAQHVFLSGDGVRLYPVELRYAWPAELDLMARLAGLRLGARYAGWGREPFGPTSQNHVSLYMR